MLKIEITKDLLLGYKDFLSYSCLASNKEGKKINLNLELIKKFEIQEDCREGKNQKIEVAFSYPELLSKENIFNIFSSLIGINEGEINNMRSIGSIGTYGKKERDYLYLVTLMINNENLIKIEKHVKRYDFAMSFYWQDEIPTTEDDVSIFWFWGKINGEAEEKIRIVKIIKEVAEYEIKYKYYLSDVEVEKNKFNNGKWGKLFIPEILDEDLIKLI